MTPVPILEAHAEVAWIHLAGCHDAYCQNPEAWAGALPMLLAGVAVAAWLVRRRGT